MASDKKRRAVIQYIDISIAILNVFVLIFAAWIVVSYIILSIINLIFIAVLVGLLIIIFLRKNPYYISPGYGIVLFGLILSFGLLTLPEVHGSLLWSGFLIIGILDIIYVADMIKGSASSLARLGISAGRVWKLVEPGTDTPTYAKVGKIDRTQKKRLQKEYHMSWIVLITAISLLMIFITLII